MNRILALLGAQAFTRVASFGRYKKGGRIRTGRTVKLLGAGTAVALAGFLALAIVDLTPSTGEADPGKAATPSEDVVEAVRQTTTFGTLGIVEGQTLRLSAVRAGRDDPAAQCKVDLKFFDIHGDAQGAGVSADLDPQQAALFDLPRADIHQDESEARAQVYAVVDVTSPAKQRDEPSCHVAMSIEVFDQQDGRTQIYQGALALTKTTTILNCCTICCEIYQGRCILERQRCAIPPAIPICPTCTR